MDITKLWELIQDDDPDIRNTILFDQCPETGMFRVVWEQSRAITKKKLMSNIPDEVMASHRAEAALWLLLENMKNNLDVEFEKEGIDE